MAVPLFNEGASNIRNRDTFFTLHSFSFRKFVGLAICHVAYGFFNRPLGVKTKRLENPGRLFKFRIAHGVLRGVFSYIPEE